jgi:mono/diheme cytochrome c family protein
MTAGMRAVASAVWLLGGLPVLAGSAAACTTDGGKALYVASCQSCHGPAGRGDGPDAALFPTPPRNLHDGVLRRYDDDDLVRRIREGRGLALPVDPAALRARVGQVDDLTAHLRRMPTVDWAAVRRGEVVYARHCEHCHGLFGEAPAPGPLDLADPKRQARLDDRGLRDLIRRGHAKAPPVSPPLGAGEERDLVAFVRSVSPGSLRYFRYCAPCHGDDGRPVGDLPADLQRPTAVFDAAYMARVDPTDLETAVWHMVEMRTPRMPHMRVLLDDAQVRAIVRWLRTQETAPPRR